jgi:hypothetical protein
VAMSALRSRGAPGSTLAFDRLSGTTTAYKPGHDEHVVHRKLNPWVLFASRDSSLALPDQDQADGGERCAIPRPLDLFDHEAGLRPVDHAGALTDPEQANGERDKTDYQKQLTHPFFLVRAIRARYRARRPEWRAVSLCARVAETFGG